MKVNMDMKHTSTLIEEQVFEDTQVSISFSVSYKAKGYLP